MSTLRDKAMSNKNSIVLILCLLVSSNSFSLPRRGGSEGGSSPTISTGTSDQATGTVIGQGAGEKCKGNETESDGSHVISYDYLISATDASLSEKEAVQLVKKGPNTYAVKIGRHIDACSKFEFKFTQAKGNVFVTAYNKYDFVNDEDLKGWINSNQEVWKKMDNTEKYTRCLKEKNLLKGEGNSAVMDWNVAREKGHISNSDESQSFSFGKVDQDTSIKLFFASAQVGFAPSGQVEPGTVDSTLKCRWYENFGRDYISEGNPDQGTKSHYLWVGRKDQVYQEVESICETGDINEILTALSKLRENHAGNFRELEKILEKTLLALQEKRAEDYKSQMIKILESEDEITEGQIKKFHNLAEKMTEDVLDPIGKQLEQLRVQYNEEGDEERKEKLMKRINKLVEVVDNSSITLDSLKPLYGHIRDKESTHSLALDIERMRGKAILFKKLNPDHEKHLALAEIDEKIDEQIESFRTSELEDWRCHAQSKRGNAACLKAAARDIKGRQTRYAKARKKYDKYYRKCQHYMQMASTNTVNLFGPSPNYEARKCKRNLRKETAKIVALGKRTSRYMQLRGEQRSRYYSNYQSYLDEQHEEEMRALEGDFYGDFRLGSLGLNEGFDDFYGFDSGFLSTSPGFDQRMMSPTSPQIFGPGMTPPGAPPPMLPGRW